MKIALIGATGNIGSAISQEALRRKHTVTGITRRTTGLSPTLAGIDVHTADVLDHAALTAAVQGHDVLASAFGPGADAMLIVDATRA
ncbi:MAG TPA: 3-beta hydroxysteroid dehydrogenase, partial [Oxalobacteraceae bacterium]|nr:3-beta hydroxysteroid dehydrogenase [Oxalobacteraceae bacterium]